MKILVNFTFSFIFLIDVFFCLQKDGIEMFKKVKTSAPGKIILCGEHAVVYGKEAIAFSLNLRTTCTIEASDKKDFQIVIPALSICASFDLKLVHGMIDGVETTDNLSPKPFRGDDKIKKLLEQYPDKLQNLSLHIITTLYISIAAAVFKKRDSGVSITLASDLPIGGGLGSSASFAVAIASSLLVICGFVSNNQETWSEQDYKLISDWAFEAERIVHGTPSGIDNSISTYGHCLSFKAGKVEQLQELDCVKLNVLVINTKVSRNTKDLVKGVKDRKEMLPHVYSSLFDSMECVTDSLKKCLLELTKEIEDTTKIEDTLKQLIYINQHLLDCIGVGHPSITQIVGTCTKYGLASKLTGAGGGGCVFALIPSDAEETLKNIEPELKSIGFDCWRTVLGGDGILIHIVA